MRRIITLIGILICVPVIILMTGWGALAIYYSNIAGDFLRQGLAAGFALATILAFIFLPNRKRTLIGFLGVFAVIVAWWLTIPASNDRKWQRDVAVLPYATVQGGQVTIHNIRNLNYRTETDFDVRYYDKTFDLNRLDSVDLIAVYWAGDAIAHIMLSFGFAGERAERPIGPLSGGEKSRLALAALVAGVIVALMLAPVGPLSGRRPTC